MKQSLMEVEKQGKRRREKGGEVKRKRSLALCREAGSGPRRGFGMAKTQLHCSFYFHAH